MPIEYREVSCPHCNQRHRLTVKDRSRLGRTIRVTCKKCEKDFETTLPISQAEPNKTGAQSGAPDATGFSEKEILLIKSLVEEFGETLQEVVETSSELGRVIQKLKAAGYNPVLMLEAIMGIEKLERTPLREPDPLVKNGEVIPNVFSSADKNWMKELRISFGNEK